MLFYEIPFLRKNYLEKSNFKFRCSTMSEAENGDDRGLRSGERTIEQMRKRIVNQRVGHRGFVTKILGKVFDETQKEDSEEVRQQFLGYKMTLIEKMDVLQRFDDEIVEDLSDVEELGHEIENAGEIRNNMHAAISRSETDRRSIPDSPERSKPKTAKLPKLKLQSFNGNPLELPKLMLQSFNGNPLELPKLKLQSFNGNPLELPKLKLQSFNGNPLELPKLMLQSFNGNPLELPKLKLQSFNGNPLELPKLKLQSFNGNPLDLPKLKLQSFNGNPLELPKLKLQSFNGNPLEFPSF